MECNGKYHLCRFRKDRSRREEVEVEEGGRRAEEEKVGGSKSDL